MKLEGMSMQTLVAMYNALSDKPATMKTFSQRSKAVERIEKLAKEQGIKLGNHFVVADDGTVSLKPKEVEAPAPAPKEKKEKAKKEPKEKKEKGPSIRSRAEALLLEVVGRDEDKRPVGHGYETIIDTIKAEFPGAKTTVACLRWYAVHMRERGTMPPTRPRPVVAKKAEEA